MGNTDQEVYAPMARKRETIEPNEGDKRYIRRDEEGKFTEDQVDVGRSLAADNNQKAKTTVPKGHGDQGETKR
jgi:hypothetical protein